MNDKNYGDDFDIGFLIYKCENRKEYWKMMSSRTEEDLHKLSEKEVSMKIGDLYPVREWMIMVSSGYVSSSDGSGSFLNSDNKSYLNLSVFDDNDLVDNTDFDIVSVMWYNK